jgi:hypothetical protein
VGILPYVTCILGSSDKSMQDDRSLFGLYHVPDKALLQLGCLVTNNSTLSELGTTVQSSVWNVWMDMLVDSYIQ